MPCRPSAHLRPSTKLLRSVQAAALLAGVWALSASLLVSTACGAEDELAAQLAAGEFAPAIAQARAASDPAVQDASLARIALAQARSGDPDASLATVSEITGDRARAQTLRDLGVPGAGRGGAAQADFDALIELIESTIAPESWDTVGGPGAVTEYEGGVLVDTQGLLTKIVRQGDGDRLAILRERAKPVTRAGDVRRPSEMRHVSLTRLEKHVQLRLASRRRPTEAMASLAGIQRIKYVFVYPESGDIVIAGPAGPWQTDGEGRQVSIDTGRPVLQLDDLVVVLRQMLGGGQERFGCSITPTQQALAQAQTFLAASAERPLRPGQRKNWLEQLRAQLGKQDIEVYGIDPRTRVARVLVEADYRMKLIGMGLEEGTLGVPSYLDLVKVPPGEAPPPMDVLRWWFTLNYQAVLASENFDAFEIRGQGVKVLSESELLAADGQRVHTGESDLLNQTFAQNFTTHFGALAEKYPIYAELQNIFDLSLVAALVAEHDVPGQVGWHLTCFGDPQAYPVALSPAPTQVETVINHRVINRKHILAGVSGGVSIDPAALVARDALETDTYGRLAAERDTVPENLGGGACPLLRPRSFLAASHQVNPFSTPPFRSRLATPMTITSG